jgi:hypothetical protein
MLEIYNKCIGRCGFKNLDYVRYSSEIKSGCLDCMFVM